MYDVRKVSQFIIFKGFWKLSNNLYAVMLLKFDTGVMFNTVVQLRKFEMKRTPQNLPFVENSINFLPHRKRSLYWKMPVQLKFLRMIIKSLWEKKVLKSIETYFWSYPSPLNIKNIMWLDSSSFFYILYFSLFFFPV